MKYYILLLSICIISACMPKYTKPKELYCPPKLVVCNPTQWNGTPIDTGRNKANAKGYYNVIESVKGLEKFKDAYHLAPEGKFTAILSAKKEHTSTFYLAQIVAKNHLITDEIMQKFPDEHLGFASLFQKSIYFSKASIIKDEDYLDKNGKHLTSMSNIVGKSRLHQANFNVGDLSNVNEIPTGFIADTVWESHISISANEKVLFFASDRPGGYGGTDIYFMFRLSDGKWSYPVNCGAAINTECNEFSPFFENSSSTLFFSSMGHQTVGGYDLFKSKVNVNLLKKPSNDGNYFSSAENLRYPINTKYDELFPSTMGNSDSLLFYSSNQASDNYKLYAFFQRNIADKNEHTRTQKDDIVKAEEKIEINTPEIKIDEPKIETTKIEKQKEINEEKNIQKAKETASYHLEGTVVSEKTDNPISNATVTVKEVEKNKVKEKTLTDESGKYYLELEKGKEFEITSEANDLFYDSYRIKVDKNDTSTFIQKINKLPEILVLRINFPYDIFDNPYPFTLDSNGIETTEKWEEAIDKVAENIKKSSKNLEKILLVGHTDDVGSVAYNKNLGQNRVDFIAEKLIERGIPRTLIKTRSAGKTELLEERTNENIDTYRKRLRRVSLEKIYKK